ncbi:MAG: glycosyltransferase family 4 protein [Limimaricola soesokkakensis]|uniref:glycosyltransferase family 4 protein n=1 Tax=Limimaricola soesokkakensis TaxID=1343159 RepID=UPI0040589736
MVDLVLNGRFLMRPPTGVDRVASELVAALLEHGLPSRFGGFSAIRPRGDTVRPEERPKAILDAATTSASKLGGHGWEQLALARARPRDWLLSLCNTGPVLRSRQVVMMHDAQAFRQPESYSRAFVRWYGTMQPMLGRRAAMVLTVSEHARADLERFGVVPKGKARVVPNGADHVLRLAPDTETLKRHGLEPGRFLLALGSLAPHKNLAMLVRAARARSDRSIPLVIAGGGDAGVFADGGITPSEDVRMLGRVSDAELRALYDNATALAFPSITEGFGLPPAEAMFCGCPVIASTGGAVPEVCGEAALSLDPNDADGWRAAMERVCAAPELRSRLAQAGRARVQRFTWKAAAATLAGHLEDLPAG